MLGRAERLALEYQAGRLEVLDELREVVRPYTEAWIRRSQGMGPGAFSLRTIPRTIIPKRDPGGTWVGFLGDPPDPLPAYFASIPEGFRRKWVQTGRVPFEPNRPQDASWWDKPIWGGWEREDASPLWGRKGQSRRAEEWEEFKRAWQYGRGEDEVVEEGEGASWAITAGYEEADLERVAEAALVEAATTYDPKHGARFTTWLAKYRKSRFLNMRSRDYRKAQKYGPATEQEPVELDLVDPAGIPERVAEWLRLVLKWPGARRKEIAAALGVTPRQGRRYSSYLQRWLTLPTQDDLIPRKNAFGVNDPTPWAADRCIQRGADVVTPAGQPWREPDPMRFPSDRTGAAMSGEVTTRTMTPEEWRTRFPGEPYPAE